VPHAKAAVLLQPRERTTSSSSVAHTSNEQRGRLSFPLEDRCRETEHPVIHHFLVYKGDCIAGCEGSWSLTKAFMLRLKLKLALTSREPVRISQLSPPSAQYIRGSRYPENTI